MGWSQVRDWARTAVTSNEYSDMSRNQAQINSLVGREDCAFLGGSLQREWSVVSCWSCLLAVVARTRVTHSPQHRTA